MSIVFRGAVQAGDLNLKNELDEITNRVSIGEKRSLRTRL